MNRIIIYNSIMKKIVLLFLLILPLSLMGQPGKQYARAKTWDKTIANFLKEDEGKQYQNPILFIGSSSFTRWDNIASYFPEHNVLNRGFGASVTTDLIYYANQIIFPYQPAQVVIYEGDNDLVNNGTVEGFIRDMKTLIRMIEINMPGVPILLVSVKPSPRRDKYLDRYLDANLELHKIARENKHISFSDVASLMMDEKGEYRYDLFAADSLHINKKGYDLWASRIKQQLISPNKE